MTTGIVIFERLGIEQKSESKRKGASIKDLWLKRRFEKRTKEWRKDTSKLEEVKKGNQHFNLT